MIVGTRYHPRQLGQAKVLEGKPKVRRDCPVVPVSLCLCTTLPVGHQTAKLWAAHLWRELDRPVDARLRSTQLSRPTIVNLSPASLNCELTFKSDEIGSLSGDYHSEHSHGRLRAQVVGTLEDVRLTGRSP